MGNLYKNFLTAVWLLAVCVAVISCSETGIEVEKQQVQFSLTPSSAADGRLHVIELPDNARALINVASSNGTSILEDHEISILKSGDRYVTEALELTTGAYTLTDFVIVYDSAALYVAPKRAAALASTSPNALPFNFAIGGNNAATISMEVTDVRNQDLDRFGYVSGRAKGNTLSLAAYDKDVLTRATVEVRQKNKLISTFQIPAAATTVSLGGDATQPYSLTVYTANAAKVQAIDLKKTKQTSTKKPFKIMLEPALVLTIQSYVDEANEYQEFFDFQMAGQGTVNVNWGDGSQSTIALPFHVEHEYFTGDYTAIITGNIQRVTDFSGFSYSSIITTITGLRNLTSLKVYDPSWGAVPIKVDLSNCKQLERINVAKYGAPYEPCNLSTDFKLPKQHRINTFIFDAPSFDITREYISAAELETMVDNIYKNVLARHIYNGKFFVNPVVTPSPTTQQKLDVLKDKYNWQVGFNDEIYNAYNDEISSGRIKMETGPEARREEWLRKRFSNSARIIKRAAVLSSLK